MWEGKDGKGLKRTTANRISSKSRKIACVPFLAILLLCMVFGLESAQAEDEVLLEAECGYDGYGKFGRNIPFSANITSTESFQGVLRIIVPANEGKENYAYEYPITVEAEIPLTVRGEIPLMSNFASIEFQCVSEKGRVLAEAQAKLHIGGRELTELYVGVLSENPDAAMAFHSVNIGEYTDSSFPYVKTRAFALSAEDIENIHYGLDCLDVIVIDRNISASLSEHQKDTLYSWVCEGGSLVAEVRSGSYIFSSVTYPVTEEVEARPYLWVQTQSVKKGKVGYFTLKVEDMDLMEFAVDNNVIPGSVISRVCSADTITAIIEQDHYYNGEETWQSVRELLNTAMGRKLPKISVYAVIIGLYLLLVGPVVYYVLRKRDKAGRTGVVVTGLAVLFSVLIYFMGTSTRFRDPIIRYASIWTLDGRLVSGKTFVDTKAPTSSPYQLMVQPEYSICPISTDNWYYNESVDKETVLRDYQVELYRGDEATNITMRQSAPFESRFFTLEKEWEERDLLGFDAELKYFNEVLRGTAYNRTQRDLEDVILVLRNGIYVIGDLKAGEERKLQDVEKLYFYPDTYQKAAGDVTAFSEKKGRMDSENQEYAALSQKTGLLKYYLSQMNTDSGTSAVLLAFLADDQEGNFQTGKQYPAHGATLVSKTVTLDTSMGGLLYQNLTSEEIGNIDEDISYNHVTNSTYSTSLRLEYYLGSVEQLRAVRFAPAEVAQDNPDYLAFRGKVYFYNPLTLVYEQVDLSRQNFWITDLEKYLVSRDGRYSMIVQYSSDLMDMERYKEIVLPIVSVIRGK